MPTPHERRCHRHVLKRADPFRSHEGLTMARWCWSVARVDATHDGSRHTKVYAANVHSGIQTSNSETQNTCHFGPPCGLIIKQILALEVPVACLLVSATPSHERRGAPVGEALFMDVPHAFSSIRSPLQPLAPRDGVTRLVPQPRIQGAT